jgi:hypothetical protein
MSIAVVPGSHVDHGLTQAQLAWVLGKFKDRTEFFIETVELPEALGGVLCGLHGPAAGTPAVPDSEAVATVRSPRTWLSRMCRRPPHQTRVVTIIAGKAEEHASTVPIDALVLFTCYGGPAAPQEPGDLRCRNVEESKKFWAEHALSLGQ